MPDGGDVDLNRQLAAIEVREARSRSVQTLRNALIDRLNPAGLRVTPDYRLDLALTRRRSSLAVQLDDTVTRYDMTITATATLVGLTDDQPLYRTAVARTASYNVLDEPFATLVAEQDAERRAAVEVASQLRALLALYFEKAARDETRDETSAPELP